MLRIAFILGFMLCCSGGLSAQQGDDSDGAKWFIVRNQHSGQCWPELLIRIQGTYRRGSGLLAGGPFTSRMQASEQILALVDPGICSKE